MAVVSLSPSSSEASAAITSITNSLATSKRVVVLVGAGISTSASIPDFRSSTGLYSSSRAGSSSSIARSSSSGTTTSLRGPELFSASVYSSPTTRSIHWEALSSFHNLATSSAPTPTHHFFSLLQKRKQLRRVYSQNIDGLELRSGSGNGILALARELDEEKAAKRGAGNGKGKARAEGQVVQLHGSILKVRCTGCSWEGEWDEEIGEAFAIGETLDCPACEEQAHLRMLQNKRKIPLKTFLRPSIVLYDEPPPIPLTSLIQTVSELDMPVADFVLVMGTTLKIPGFKSLVKDFCKRVKGKGGLCVFVNLEKASAEWQSVFNYQIIGKTDNFVVEVEKQWRRSRPRDWVGAQSTLPFSYKPTVTKLQISNGVQKHAGPRKALTTLPSAENLQPLSSSPLSSLLASSTPLPHSSSKTSLSASVLDLSSTPPSQKTQQLIASQPSSSPSISISASSSALKRKRIPYVLIESPARKRRK